MPVNVPYLRYLENLRSGGIAATAPTPAKGLRSLVSKHDLAVYEPTSTEKTDAAIAEISKAGVVAGSALGEAVATKKESLPPTDRSTTSSITVVDDDGKEVIATPEQISTSNPDAVSAEEDSLGLMSKPETSNNPVLKMFTADIEKVKGNSRFMTILSEMQDKYPGLTEEEIFIALGRESNFGKNMGSIGNAFQIKKIINGKLNEKTAGIDFDFLEASTNLADHLEAFDTYLSNWKYDGKASIGIMLAAPSSRNAKPSTVVYKKDSLAAKQNPKWQNSTGNVTVRSINSFYRGQS